MLSQQKVNNCHDDIFISNNTLFINKKTLYCYLFVYVYFHRTMEEFTLTRSYVK